MRRARGSRAHSPGSGLPGTGSEAMIARTAACSLSCSSRSTMTTFHRQPTSAGDAPECRAGTAGASIVIPGGWKIRRKANGGGGQPAPTLAGPSRLRRGAHHADTSPNPRSRHGRPARPPPGRAPDRPAASAAGPLASSIAVDWQRTAARTIYVERGTAPPLGALYLAFTSLAVHDAAREAQKHGTHAAAAAVAVAAHDVLLEYFPLSGALDADLAASLARVPDGKKEAAGVAIGAAAADTMIASRVGDGRNDASIIYTRPPPSASGSRRRAGAMALPWLGFVDPVVDVEPVALDGPDPTTRAPPTPRTTRRRARSGRSPAPTGPRPRRTSPSSSPRTRC